jgi:glyoxylase-like metal-dependent hydrolase (beta-lactamase superfamily II)
MTTALAISVMTVLAHAAPMAGRSAEGVAIVRRAAEALGGADRLSETRGIEYGIQGEARFPYQGPAPENPGTFQYTESTAMEFPTRRMTVTSGFTGGETAFTRTVSFDGGSASAHPDIARQLRQAPHAILREWLGAPRYVLLAGETEEHWIVSGPLYGALVHAHIDRVDHLVDRVEVAYDDTRHGDASAVAEFLEYQRQGDWRVPRRIRVVEGGTVIFDLPYSVYRLDVQVAAPEPPSAEVPATDAPPRAEVQRPGPDTFLHRDHGGGVRVLFNTGGPDYHSLAVSTAEGVVVVETPGSVTDGRALIERAGALGRVAFVAATHHHDDHAGAMPGAASEDRRVVVAESHRDFFRDMITAPRSFLAATFVPVAAPGFLTVPSGGERPLAGGRVIAYDAGPTGHSDAQLVFYVPDGKLLFQSDMAVFRWDGSVEPGREQTCRLRAFIAEKALDVDVIVGGHGRPGTLADLDEAIRLREEGC